MSALSKFFEDNVKYCTCNEIVHTGSCTKNILLNIHKFFLSNCKYFAPLVGLPLLVHIRTLNKDVLKSALQYYLAAVWCGSSTGLSIMALICLLRHSFGAFKRYSFVFTPALIGGFAILATPNLRVHRLFETSIFQCTIESFLMKRRNVFTKAIADSLLLQTWIFMCCSGLILHAKREKLFNGFWLLKPTPKLTHNITDENTMDLKAEENSETPAPLHHHQHSCSHAGKTCTAHVLQGARNYMVVGLALDLIKALMSKVAADRRGFSVKLLAKLSNFQIRSSALLASYMTVYRLSHCWLNRKSGADTPSNHAIAAFLGGSCYRFYPKLTLLSFALVLSAQTLWQRIEMQKRSPCSVRADIFERFKKLPYAKLLYPLSLAYLVHMYCFQQCYVSNLAETIIDGVTDNYARKIRESILRLQQQMTVGATL